MLNERNNIRSFHMLEWLCNSHNGHRFSTDFYERFEYLNIRTSLTRHMIPD